MISMDRPLLNRDSQPEHSALKALSSGKLYLRPARLLEIDIRILKREAVEKDY